MTPLLERIALAAHDFIQADHRSRQGAYGHRDWGALAKAKVELETLVRHWLQGYESTGPTHHDRYEFLRTLNPRQFHDLWEENLKTGKPFDTLVDEYIAARHWEKQ